MHPLLERLAQIPECRVAEDTFKGAEDGHIVIFIIDDVRVTIRIVFGDELTNADVLITNMTTLPSDSRLKVDKTRKGYGSKCLGELIECALAEDLFRIRATQVNHEYAENFWQKNHFIPTRNWTNDYLYVPAQELRLVS